MRRCGILPLALAVVALPECTLHAGEIEDYLSHNKQVLELGDGFNASLLDTKGKSIFLLGEAHAIAGNELLDLALLRYLHRTAGVRFYVSEGAYSANELLNQYLANGDQRLLDFLMDEMRGSPAWNKENREYYRKLGEWNRSLPANERIRIAGVDVEHQQSVAWRYLAELTAAGGTAPESIREVLARLSRPNGSDAIDRDLAASLAAHRDDYAKLLGPHLADFEIVVGNLVKRDEYYQSNSRQLRDTVMYETFRTVAKRYPGAKWFGRWGTAHVLQRRMENYDPCAMLFEQDPEYKGKVLSIVMLFRNSTALSPNGYRAMPVNDGADQAAMLAPFAGDSRFTLFRSPNVPLPQTGNVKVADIAQYLLLVQNAVAAQPLHDVPNIAKVAAAPPVVVRTVPESGATDVSPELTEVRITFSKPMQDRSWAFVFYDGAEKFPGIGPPHYDTDHRTVVVKVKLEPGKTYGMWLNAEKFQGFRDLQGQPALPYPLLFQTRK